MTARKKTSKARKSRKASAAKKTPKAKAPKSRKASAAKKTPKAKAPQAKAKDGEVSVEPVNLGHVLALRPRVNTSFPQAEFLKAKRELAGERFGTIEEAARAPHFGGGQGRRSAIGRLDRAIDGRRCCRPAALDASELRLRPLHDRLDHDLSLLRSFERELAAAAGDEAGRHERPIHDVGCVDAHDVCSSDTQRPAQVLGQIPRVVGEDVVLSELKRLARSRMTGRRRNRSRIRPSSRSQLIGRHALRSSKRVEGGIDGASSPPSEIGRRAKARTSWRLKRPASSADWLPAFTPRCDLPPPSTRTS